VMISIVRLIAMFAVMPILHQNVVKGRVRNGIILSIGCVLYPFIQAKVPVELPTLAWAGILIKEVMIGFVMGFMFAIFFWTIQSVGELIDLQTGSSNNQIFNPMSGEQGGPTGGFMLQMMVNLFLSTGGFLTILSVVFESYQIWPIFTFFPKVNDNFLNFFIGQTNTMFVSIVKFASPILLILIAVDFGLGLMNRVAQQLNAFSLSQPIKGALATLMLAMFLSYLYDSLSAFLSPEAGIQALFKSIS
jgi:type III secretion protein T